MNLMINYYLNKKYINKLFVGKKLYFGSVNTFVNTNNALVKYL